MANSQQHPDENVPDLAAPLLNPYSIAQISIVPPQDPSLPTQGSNVPPSPNTPLDTPDDAENFRWLSRSSRGKSYRCPIITSS